MAVNRYTSVNWNQPMSSYTPLPFEQLAKVGQTMQKNYQEGVQESYKLNDLMATVNAIDQHKPYKKVLEAKYYPKLEEITNKIVNQGDMNAKRELNQLARQWQNDPLRQELEKSYQDYNTDVKSINELKQKGLYTDVYNPITGFTGSLDTGDINPYRTKGARPVQDYLKTGSELMKDIAKSGASGKSYKIDDAGNVIGLESGWEAVYQKDVDRVANQSVVPFLKSNEGQFFIDELKYNNPNLNQQQVLGAANEYLKNLGNKQVFKTTEYGQDFKYAPKYVYDKGQGKDEFVGSLIGQTIEGQTYNPIESDKTFQGLKDSGVFKTDATGNIKIDWLELNKPEKTYTQYSYDKGSVGRATGEKPAIARQTEVANQMKKMADVVGYKGKIDSDHYDLIASAYNVLNKARLFGEQLSAPVSNLESDKITRNWEQTTAFNPNDINKLTEKPKLQEGDKIVITERQTNSEGEIIKKGSIVNKDGTRTPIALKSNSLEDSGYFDRIGSIGINSAKYQVGEVKPVNKTADGLSVIHETEIPYVGYVATVGNPRDKSQIQYRVVTEDGQRKAFTNYSDLQRYLEMEYYDKTPEGKADTQELINRKKQFETNFEE